VTGVDAPQHQGLQDGEQRGGELCTPDAAQSVVILAPGDRRADAVLTALVVYRNFGMVDEYPEPGPVLEQTGEHLVLLRACTLGQTGARRTRLR
jgi:hypothetical protein